ncbi:hypothetical protein NKH18_17220 [Streptomyces sp. M10(2022)]
MRAGFAPIQEEPKWARRVLATGEAVSAVDGMMADRPVRERARRLLGAGTGGSEARAVSGPALRLSLPALRA